MFITLIVEKCFACRLSFFNRNLFIIQSFIFLFLSRYHSSPSRRTWDEAPRTKVKEREKEREREIKDLVFKKIIRTKKRNEDEEETYL